MATVRDLLLAKLDDLLDADLKHFHGYLTTESIPEGFDRIRVSRLEGADRIDTVALLLQVYRRDGAMKITQETLKKMQLAKTAKRDKEREERKEREEQKKREEREEQNKVLDAVRAKLKSSLKARYNNKYQKTGKKGQCIDETKFHTELHMIKGISGGVIGEQEVTHNQAISPATGETIKTTDLFKEESKKLMTLGMAGVGKTLYVWMTILDWAEGKEHQHIDFMFLLPFHEMNKLKEKEDLMETVSRYYPEMEPIKALGMEFNILFIFDGLDESRLHLDFEKEKEVLRNVTRPASIDVKISNLITGELLPSAWIWITSRPAAANQIPSGYQWTEIRGFNDPQKEEYFRKRISDPNLAERIINHVKSSRSLNIMCQNPMFCWLSAGVLERLLGGAESREMPETLTQMYTKFLEYQIDKKRAK